MAAYDTREGPLSLAAHRRCFDAYAGPKVELTVPVDLHAPAPEFVAWVSGRD